MGLFLFLCKKHVFFILALRYHWPAHFGVFLALKLQDQYKETLCKGFESETESFLKYVAKTCP